MTDKKPTHFDLDKLEKERKAQERMIMDIIRRTRPSRRSGTKGSHDHSKNKKARKKARKSRRRNR